jgi:ubiquinone/menaquinone biosynthesis C-methylase UbiE
MSSELPSRELLETQAEWLAAARARILRLAEIAKRKSILDLGAGYGIITNELRRRTLGHVIALDHSLTALHSLQPCVCAEAFALPFLDRSFDLMFSQNVMLWVGQSEATIKNVHRVLQSGGAWVLIEPDYKGMIEYPSELETGHLWITALKRAGADPEIGRKLPVLLRQEGFNVRTELLPRLQEPSPKRFEFLFDLNLSEEERRELERIKKQSDQIAPSKQISHLPYFLIIAERP